MTFHEWYQKLLSLAEDKMIQGLIPPEENYPEDSWIDDISPEEELEELISCCGE